MGRLRTVLALIPITAAIAATRLPALGSLQQAPPAIQVVVTGDPVPGPFVARAVERAVRWAMPEEDLTVALISPPAGLSTGAAAVIRARVGIRGTPSTRTAVVTVHVRNQSTPCQTARLLFVSNSPEMLRFATGLFRGSLATGETVRLVYHHRNGTGGQMELRVAAANPTGTRVRLWVNDASAPPARDELMVGHLAASRWLPQYWTCTAQAVEIAPHSTLILDTLTLGAEQVGSGVVQAWLLQGERVILDVQARVGAGDPAQASYLIAKDAPHVRGIFESPVWELQVAHSAGAVTLLTIGDPVHAPETSSGRRLRGNYGVIYNVRGTLANPTREPQKVVVRAVAAGGAARGTFLIQGRVVDAGFLRPGTPAIVTSIPLAPGARVPFFLSTMPQPGSAYPVRLLLGPP